MTACSGSLYDSAVSRLSHEVLRGVGGVRGVGREWNDAFMSKANHYDKSGSG